MAGGWKGSTRKARLPPDWPRRRAQVLARDNYRCFCGMPATDVDHVVPGDDHRLSNLRSLCRAHHLQKSSKEGVSARKHRRRPPEPHPGLLH